MTETSASWERNFREQMRVRREGLGYTQTALANFLRDAGLPFHQQTVQKVESGDRPVRLDEAYLIAETLQTDLPLMVQDPELAQRTQELERMSEYVFVVGAEISNAVRVLLRTREDLGVKVERAEEADDVPPEVLKRAKHALEVGTTDHFFEQGHKAFYDG